MMFVDESFVHGNEMSHFSHRIRIILKMKGIISRTIAKPTLIVQRVYKETVFPIKLSSSNMNG